MPDVIASTAQIGPPVLGVILPAIVLGLSFVVTILLVRYFTRNQTTK